MEKVPYSVVLLLKVSKRWCNKHGVTCWVDSLLFRVDMIIQQDNSL